MRSSSLCGHPLAYLLPVGTLHTLPHGAKGLLPLNRAVQKNEPSECRAPPEFMNCTAARPTPQPLPPTSSNAPPAVKQVPPPSPNAINTLATAAHLPPAPPATYLPPAPRLPTWMALWTANQTACAASLARERGRFASWKHTVSDTSAEEYHHNGYNHLFVLKRFPHVAYLANQKTGSSSMRAALRAVGGYTETFVPYYSSNESQTQWLCEEHKLSFVFTFIREPLTCAWSAYKEVSFRKNQLVADFERNVMNNCSYGDRRYAAYLDAMRRGYGMSIDAYHSWPQVLKIDVRLPVRCGLGDDGINFNFVGSIENATEDIPRLAANPGFGLNAQEQRTFALQFSLNEANVKKNSSVCSKQLLASHSQLGISNVTLSLLCQIYEIDYACLGYPLPPLCHVHPVDPTFKKGTAQLSPPPTSHLVRNEGTAQPHSPPMPHLGVHRCGTEPPCPANKTSSTRNGVFWLHFPKCGTSFRNSIKCPVLHGEKEANTCQAGTPLFVSRGHTLHKSLTQQCKRGHIMHKSPTPGGWVWYSCNEEQLATAAMFRPPEERLMSSYFYIISKSGARCCTDDWGWETSVWTSVHSRIRHGQSPAATIGNFSGCYTRMILGYGCMSQWPLSSQNVSQAIARVSKFRFVGIVGQWPLSMCLFNKVVMGVTGLYREQVNNTRPTQLSNNDETARAETRNRSTQYNVSAIPQDWADRKVYAYAEERFRADLSRNNISDFARDCPWL